MKKYKIIYADPPWKYDFSKDNKDRVENHYPTMSLEEIKSLNIPSDDNCVLYLWATAPKLLEALEVMRTWGFTYKTQAIWDKEWIGMGYWFRGQHEILLVGTKGKISPPNYKNRVSSVIREKRTKHSKKPDFVRDLISKSFPDYNKLELFARENNEGWDVWGNEVESDIKL
jgi:N6-adenosine-specific RNA methylase IME4